MITLKSGPMRDIVLQSKVKEKIRVPQFAACDQCHDAHHILRPLWIQTGMGGEVVWLCEWCYPFGPTYKSEIPKKNKRESTAWCECGDALETKEIWKKDKNYGKVIDHHEYYCLGCDKTYVLINKKRGGR